MTESVMKLPRGVSVPAISIFLGLYFFLQLRILYSKRMELLDVICMGSTRKPGLGYPLKYTMVRAAVIADLVRTILRRT